MLIMLQLQAFAAGACGDNRREHQINEYGVFRSDDGARVAGANEEEVYASIGLPWIPPELREDRQEFEWAQFDQLPSLNLRRWCLFHSPGCY
jgi:hypothetical protein